MEQTKLTQNRGSMNAQGDSSECSEEESRDISSLLGGDVGILQITKSSSRMVSLKWSHLMFNRNAEINSNLLYVKLTISLFPEIRGEYSNTVSYMAVWTNSQGWGWWQGGWPVGEVIVAVVFPQDEPVWCDHPTTYQEFRIVNDRKVSNQVLIFL